MPVPRAAAAVGAPVTLHLKDGRQLHGVLAEVTPEGYTLAQTIGHRSYPRAAVRSLTVRRVTR